METLFDEIRSEKDRNDSTSVYYLFKIHFRKKKYERSLDVRNVLPCKINYSMKMISTQVAKRWWRKKKKGKRKTEISTEKKLQRCVIPSKDNSPPEMTEWLYRFQWSNAERIFAIDRLIEKCGPSLVRRMIQLIKPQFQKDLIFPPLQKVYTVGSLFSGASIFNKSCADV